MLAKLNQADFASEIVISMNGVESHEIDATRTYWSALNIPHVILWNDSLRVSEQLTSKGLHFSPGKGLNIWLAVGWLVANRTPDTLLIHDCDIVNYDLDLPVTLSRPICEFGYSYCKGYYSRVREELFGRVTRLFVIPFIRSLTRVAGHMPLLDFIDSFRYPLSGECQ
jgi:glucosyl-3-phosphoglycerate synthase